MYKRFELHNHTLESDGAITVNELLELMLEDKVDCFAITDHNTISGHHKLLDIISKDKPPVSCMFGMEYTTYYGHILCPDLTEYVPWENINMHNPELLFDAVHATGALAGIAHPFSYGHPFARGCRFDMKVTDYSKVDFIEIFNNPEPLIEVNMRGIEWWEKLILEGHHIAITAGMDLHRKTSMHDKFATYCEGHPAGDAHLEFKAAIRNCRTWISKGYIPEISHFDNFLEIGIADLHKPGCPVTASDNLILTLKGKEETLEIPLNRDAKTTVRIKEKDATAPLIPKLYRNSVSPENLIAVAPVIYC